MLELVAAGKANRSLPANLGTEPEDGRNHVSNIFLKIQVPDRAAAIIKARDAGFGGSVEVIQNVPGAICQPG